MLAFIPHFTGKQMSFLNPSSVHCSELQQMANVDCKGKFENKQQSQWRKQIIIKEKDIKTILKTENLINRNKIWSFEKTNKIDKTQASVIMKIYYTSNTGNKKEDKN